MTYTHTHMKVARMEAAVEVLGSQIAQLSAAIEDERTHAAPNQGVIDALRAQIVELRDQQDDLSSNDLATVARILGEQATSL